jgi:hypothetical protein
MDDIIEKLRLLDYESNFCKNRKYKTISRIYFAIPGEGTVDGMPDKLKMMYELSYWLMSLSKVLPKI